MGKVISNRKDFCLSSEEERSCIAGLLQVYLEILGILYDGEEHPDEYMLVVVGYAGLAKADMPCLIIDVRQRLP